jgi:hypothetical protein
MIPTLLESGILAFLFLKSELKSFVEQLTHTRNLVFQFYEIYANA